MKTTATRAQVIEAISKVNQKYGYKLELATDQQQTARYYSFTLKTPSGIPGARVGTSGRNMAKASWHAHGYLFDELLTLAPDAVIISAGRRIDKAGGNWIDTRVAPNVMYSQLSIV